jgi:hypothetical protein
LHLLQEKGTDVCYDNDEVLRSDIQIQIWQLYMQQHFVLTLATFVELGALISFANGWGPGGGLGTVQVHLGIDRK